MLSDKPPTRQFSAAVPYPLSPLPLPALLRAVSQKCRVHELILMKIPSGIVEAVTQQQQKQQQIWQLSVLTSD